MDRHFCPKGRKTKEKRGLTGAETLAVFEWREDEKRGEIKQRRERSENQKKENQQFIQKTVSTKKDNRKEIEMERKP